MRLSILALALLAAPVAAGEPVAAENPVAPNKFVEVKCPLEKGDAVLWEVSPEPKKVAEHVTGDVAVLYFNGDPGTYTVRAILVNFDAKKLTRKNVIVTIDGALPVPPKPVPPVPPNDPLKEKIRTAYLSDNPRREDALQLAELYRQAVAFAADKDIASSAALLAAMRRAGEAVFLEKPDTLLAVRRAIAGELAVALGKSNDEPLTDTERKRAGDLFTKLVAILEELAK